MNNRYVTKAKNFTYDISFTGLKGLRCSVNRTVYGPEGYYIAHMSNNWITTIDKGEKMIEAIEECVPYTKYPLH